MLDYIALISIIGGLNLLYFLSKIDFKQGILPNELVLGFGIVGFVFHITTLFYYADVIDIGFGMVIGGGLLYLIREGANWYYKQDTLGLGDVKLMAAAGVWLGPQGILIAMTLGALAGFLHGVFVALRTKIVNKVDINLGKLSIPAGPGFAIGIIAAGIYKFWDFSSSFFIVGP